MSFAIWMGLTGLILTAWALLDRALGRAWNRRPERRAMARRIARQRGSTGRRSGD